MQIKKYVDIFILNCILFLLLSLNILACKSLNVDKNPLLKTASNCPDSLVIQTFIQNGYKAIEANKLELIDINKSGVVEESVHIIAHLKDKILDVNKDIVPNTEKIAKALRPTKGFIKSINTCEDFLKFKTFLDDGSFKERNKEFLYLVEVITTNRLNESNTIWVLTSSHY